MTELIVPPFARLHDWLGPWACEEVRFRGLLDALGGGDLAAHVAAAPPPPARSTLTLVPAGGGGRSVAVVSLTGTLMKSQSSYGGTSTVQARRDVRTAAADPGVSAILLAIDSPGGTVAGTADLAAEVAAARRSKPVWAHVDDLGASAAYWVASQAGAVYANTATALVGSIGTLQVVTDYSAAAGRQGVTVHTFRTGPLKGAGTPGAPLSDEQAAHFQALVEKTQQSFTRAVAAGRGLTGGRLERVLTGGVWVADEARDLGLVDGVRPLAETVAALGKTN